MISKKTKSKKLLIFVAAICLIAFTVALTFKIFRYFELKSKIATFEKKIAALEEKKALLIEDIQSVDDPVWLELALMEELGVIPEGAIKINYLGEM